jgi:hypothetical protein
MAVLRYLDLRNGTISRQELRDAQGASTDIWPLVSAAEAILLALVPGTHPPAGLMDLPLLSPFSEGDARQKQSADRL